jgi:hypothetical protein
MALMLKALYQKIVRGLGLDYNEVLTEEIKEGYIYGTPLPRCNVSGCTEEMHTKGKTVYGYCEDHLNKYSIGIKVSRVCEYPSCNVDIVDSAKLYCDKCQEIIMRS